ALRDPSAGCGLAASPRFRPDVASPRARGPGGWPLRSRTARTAAATTPCPRRRSPPQATGGRRAEELPPGHRRTRRRWSDTGAAQDGPHGARPDPALVTEPAQLAVDATMPPGGALPGQPQPQRPDIRRYGGPATPGRVGPAAGDQAAMPAQQRFGPDEHPVPA